MVGEILASLGAFKTMLDMAKALKDINDATIRNGAVIELQEQILAAQETQTAALERIRELKEEVASYETWSAEKQRYELKAVHPGAFAHVLKPAMSSSEPPHWLCAKCYQDRKKYLLQSAGFAAQSGPDSRKRMWKCPMCGAGISVHFSVSPEVPAATGVNDANT
jgi:hypothetical protein